MGGLVRIQPLVTAWRIRAFDGLIGAATFVGTLALAPDLHLGVGLGVGASLVLNFYRTMRPRVVFLARHLDGTLRGSDEGLRPDQQLAIMRFDGQLYFGSSRYFEDKVLETIASAPELRYLILDANGINRIDASGEQTLRNVVERLREVGIDLYLTQAKRQLIDALERSGLMEQIGRDHFFLGINTRSSACGRGSIPITRRSVRSMCLVPKSLRTGKSSTIYRESEPLGVGGRAICVGGVAGQQLGEGVEAGIGSVDERVFVLASAKHFFGDIERGQDGDIERGAVPDLSGGLLHLLVEIGRGEPDVLGVEVSAVDEMIGLIVDADRDGLLLRHELCGVGIKKWGLPRSPLVPEAPSFAR